MRRGLGWSTSSPRWWWVAVSNVVSLNCNILMLLFVSWKQLANLPPIGINANWRQSCWLFGSWFYFLSQLPKKSKTRIRGQLFRGSPVNNFAIGEPSANANWLAIFVIILPFFMTWNLNWELRINWMKSSLQSSRSNTHRPFLHLITHVKVHPDWAVGYDLGTWANH